MTLGGIGSGHRAGLLERLFAKADADSSAGLDAGELAALMPDDDAAGRAGALVKQHDRDADGHLSLAEVTEATLTPETLSGLLSIAGYAAASRTEREEDDAKAIDAFFDRADLDGDGSLNQAEYDAGRVAEMAESLDSGAAAPQHMFVVQPDALSDGKLSRDEIMVARRLMDVATPVSLDDPNLDPELVEAIRNLPPPEPPAEDAPAEAETVLADTIRSADLTQALIERLIRQLERAQPATQGLSLTA